MHTKSQVSLEYLLIIGFSLLMITVALGLYSNYQTHQGSRIAASQMQHIGEKLTSTAEEVHYQGIPARQTVTVYMPAEVDSVRITPVREGFSSELMFRMQSGTEMEFVSPLNMTGTINATGGLHEIVVEATKSGARMTG